MATKKTTKKAPSAAQLAARALFAKRAKAGTLGKAKRKPAAKAKPAAKRAPAKRAPAKRAPAKRAPAKRKANPNPYRTGRAAGESSFSLYYADTAGRPVGKPIVHAASEAVARTVGQLLADKARRRVVVVRRV